MAGEVDRDDPRIAQQGREAGEGCGAVEPAVKGEDGRACSLLSPDLSGDGVAGNLNTQLTCRLHRWQLSRVRAYGSTARDAPVVEGSVWGLGRALSRALAAVEQEDFQTHRSKPNEIGGGFLLVRGGDSAGDDHGDPQFEIGDANL